MRLLGGSYEGYAMFPALAIFFGLLGGVACGAFNGLLVARFNIQPMVATLIGILFFSEPLTLLSGLGILLILAAVILLNRS